MKHPRALVLLLACALPAAAEKLRVHITWEALGLITGSHVRIAMPTAQRVEGIVTAVDPDALFLDVSKSSNPSVHPLGKLIVPRSSLKMFELRKKPGKLWRGVGLGLGAAIPMSLTAANVGKPGWFTRIYDSGDLAAIALSGAGGAAAGYFLGRHLDRGGGVYLTYIIIPSTPQQ